MGYKKRPAPDPLRTVRCPLCGKTWQTRGPVGKDTAYTTKFFDWPRKVCPICPANVGQKPEPEQGQAAEGKGGQSL